jgi:hypothetical protein
MRLYAIWVTNVSVDIICYPFLLSYVLKRILGRVAVKVLFF